MPQVFPMFRNETIDLKPLAALALDCDENADVIFNYKDMTFRFDAAKSHWFIYEDNLFNINEFKFNPDSWTFQYEAGFATFNLLPVEFGVIKIWV